MCPSCKHELESIDLLPLFSFIYLRGKCRHCHHAISPRYFFVELCCALFFTLVFIQINPSSFHSWLLLVTNFCIIAILILTFVIDFEHFLILDVVVFPAVAVIFVLHGIDALYFGHGVSAIIPAVIGAVVGALPLFLIWLISKGAWMGFGDVKYMLFMGVALGWQLSLLTVIIAVFMGTIVGVGLIVWRNKSLKSQVPFGTFLSAAALVCLFYGPDLLAWYLKLLGF